MKIATFTEGGKTRLGIVRGDSVVDLSRAAPKLPTDMKSFLLAGETAWDKARMVAGDSARTMPIADVRLEAPITNPGKILAIGLNYGDHVTESGVEKPKHQIWFNKQCNTVAGPEDPVLIPFVAPHYVDYEAEMVVVIGKHCRHVPRERAGEVIFGYTCGNDVSVRDWQLRTPQFTLGKSFAGHAPIGPWVVTADEFGDPHDKDLKGYVNGELRQSSNTRHLIFDCYDQIAELSAVFALEPGDLIFSGTPGGVGGAMKPPRFLKAGDRVRIEIDGVGSLESTFVDETETLTEIR
jgi:2-keto-4-pentenoate hydratase/2-oxohepta-3-ene-1,7-dioic acid hydratase in catechol pathway